MGVPCETYTVDMNIYVMDSTRYWKDGCFIISQLNLCLWNLCPVAWMCRSWMFRLSSRDVNHVSLTVKYRWASIKTHVAVQQQQICNMHTVKQEIHMYVYIITETSFLRPICHTGWPCFILKGLSNVWSRGCFLLLNFAWLGTCSAGTLRT